MKASTLHDADAHFLARMDEAAPEEQDAIFAELAARAIDGDELAKRTIRVLALPACRRIAATKGDQVVAALVDAAYEEVIDWAVREGRATR
jgi:hypothetical protein